MPFWKKSSSPPHAPVMKSIVYRGGVITFRIPFHWREEYSDIDGGTFYEDCANSGTLRLKIISAVAPRELQDDSAMDVLQVALGRLKSAGVQVTTRMRKDGNAVLKYQQGTSERGTSLTIFYWVVANTVPPRHVRVVTFSYTVLAEVQNEPQVQRKLEMLEAEIEAATFSHEIGVIPE